MPRLSFACLLVVAAGCSKSDKKPDPPPSASIASAALTPSASASSRAHKRNEDRHEAAEKAAALSLEVNVAGASKTWTKEAFDRVPKMTKGNVGNDGEDRETWSLRDLAHVLVGPSARVASVSGDATRTIDAATWSDASRTPILHTTRRGTLKFRWADKDGKWSDTEVKDVSRLEIVP